ncbi:MAG: replication protein [Blastocatellia bacterium]
MSKEQSPPVREVEPYRPNKRKSTARILKLDFAGTALEQALAQQEKLTQSSEASNVSPTQDDSLTKSDSLTRNAKPSLGTSLTQNVSPTSSESLTQSDTLAHRDNSLMREDRLTDSVGLSVERSSAIDLMASLPKVKGHLKLYHQITDHLYGQLDPYEQAVHLQLFRLSWGYGKPTCLIGLPKLATRAGMGTTAAAQAVKKLIAKGLIKKLGMKFGKNQEQGIEYWVRPPDSLLQSVSLSQSDSLPQNVTNKEISSSDKNTQTQGRGSARSSFSLEECRRYADYLHKTGQGIERPGGYATAIYRSGDADALIEAFLSSPVQVDISNCPDCRGTKWRYKDASDFDKGVIECEHKNMP